MGTHVWFIAKCRDEVITDAFRKVFTDGDVPFHNTFVGHIKHLSSQGCWECLHLDVDDVLRQIGRVPYHRGVSFLAHIMAMCDEDGPRVYTLWEDGELECEWQTTRGPRYQRHGE